MSAKVEMPLTVDGGSSRKRRSSRRRRNRRNNIQGPSASAIVYRGPVIIGRGLKDQEQTTCVRLTYVQAVLDTSGTISQAYANNPNISLHWADFVNTWDEYRVLSTRLTWIPYSWPIPNAVYTGYAPSVWVIDRDSSTPPSSYGTAFDYESAQITMIGLRHSIVTRMSGVEDSGFINTGLPVATWWNHLYATNLTPSGSTWGRIFLEWNVQFRSRV